MRTATAALLASCLAAAPARAGSKPEPPALTAEHRHPSGGFGFRTPADWTVTPLPDTAGGLEASGPNGMVRFFYRAGEIGYDALHAECMLQRLAGPMATEAWVKYDYDFLSGEIGDLRILESAFQLRYDAPIRGEHEWRQRNVTVVGGGHSLCIVAYAPTRLYKKDKALRALLDAVVASVRFTPAAAPSPGTP